MSLPASPRRRQATVPTSSSSTATPRRRRAVVVQRRPLNAESPAKGHEEEDPWSSDVESVTRSAAYRSASRSVSADPTNSGQRWKPSVSVDKPPRPAPKPTLFQTLRIILLSPLRTLSIILSPIFSPLIAHAINILILLTLSILAWRYLLPHLIRYVGWTAWQPIKFGWRLLMGKTSGLAVNTGKAGEVMGKVMGGVCTVAPLLCTGFGVLNPAPPEVDVASVARALHREASDARDIFDSVANLGSGGMEAGLHYTKIWELATAISVSSNLQDKQQLGADLMELGGLSRDLSDDMSKLSAESNSAFTWIVTDFDRLFQALSDPTTSKAALANIDVLVHSLMLRIGTTLDDLLLSTERAIPKADQASALGTGLMKEMRRETDRLETHLRKEPPWKRWAEKGKEFAIGQQEPSLSEVLKKDLEFSVSTINNVRDLHAELAGLRHKLRLHADHVGRFKSNLIGFHIGAAAMDPVERAVYGPEIELKVLREVIEHMKGAVQASKTGGRPNRSREGIAAAAGVN